MVVPPGGNCNVTCSIYSNSKYLFLEPKTAPKPQPIGNIALIILLTTCTSCILFLLWRRAEAFRAAISHQLKTITRSEGQIRLSQDDGPPAHEFLEDDESTDNAFELDTGDVGPLPERQLVPAQTYLDPDRNSKKS
ncbi:hypothetical protein J3R30DRAFT_3287452 [Lentinula aciculospora]|uniref:Uncharacterized protein n=1 Tax=Lentinula aciculospora TaxID=153920 RepID=A0A9W9DR92_9AGAR|nr:hypothetical protein J3R30DRAFT_3287452 [Lentinula aciculospora]